MIMNPELISPDLPPEAALAEAVVLQAVDDWRAAAEILSRRPDHALASARLRDAERFFLSRWFRALTDMDGAALLDRLRREEQARRRAVPDAEFLSRRRRARRRK